MTISSAVDITAIARTVGIGVNFVNFNAGGVVNLPQRVMLVGQGNTSATYATTKRQVTSAAEVGRLYGFGSPLHSAALQLLPANNDGLRSIPLTVYPLEDAGSSVASAGTIVVTGTGTAQRTINVLVNNVRSGAIVVSSGTSANDAATAIAAAINGNLNMPSTAVAVTGTVTLTSKWKGVTANDIQISIDGPADHGLTLAITQPSAGAVNPAVDEALSQIGEVWETMIVNCLGLDPITLNAYEVFNEGRWDPEVRRPLIVFSGHNTTDVATITTIGDARRTQRTHSLAGAPGSRNLPSEIAAAHVARIARSANNNPARDFARLTLPFISPGLDSQQWTSIQRQQAVLGGASTVRVRDNVLEISDTVTTNHPTGETNPGYRHVKSLVKIMNVLFNVDLIFNTATWDGAPLIPNDQPTVNPDAKRPKDAIAVLSTLANNLALQAIISDLPFTLENLRSGISSQNPDRLDTAFPVKVSGNVNVQSIDLNFGHFFGEQTIIG